MAVPTQAPPAARMPPRSPQFSLSRGKHTSTIKIAGWTITTTKKPIYNGREIEAAEKALNLPLPEMTFGNNSLSLSYHPESEGSTSSTAPSGSSPREGVSLEWNTLDALSMVGVGEDWEERIGGGVQVSMAEKWSKGRSSSPSLLSDVAVPTKPVKPHDWTYSTVHTGSVAVPSTFTRSETHSLPLDLLARQDPILDQILFYDDVSLFEDELHDHGESIHNVRIRVMPHCWFILSRLFLRVDDVLFRIYDVRVYHQFGSGEIIKEVKGMEASYEDVKKKLETPTDLSPLTDSNFVYGIMTSRPQVFQSDGRPKLDHRPTGSQKGKSWPGLGEFVEVLHLPSGEDGITERVNKLHV